MSLSETLQQNPTAIAFKTAEDGDTFFLLALFSEYRDIQNPCLIVNGKVKAFHHTASHQNVHKELIPASLLCQKIAFKLSAPTTFQFHQNSFVQFMGAKDEYVA